MRYKVPFVNYPLQYKNLKKEIDTTITRALSRGDLILRSDVEKFEKNTASFLGVKYAVGVNSCTDSLIFSLRAAGIGKGDEVITVAHTFVATIEAIIHCGARPILVDVGDDYNMDMDKLKAVITNKTKAIIPVHFNGRVCDMKKLMTIAKKHNLILIEDAAQALGAKFDGKKAGSFGLSSCFSFYPAKLLGALGDAGIVCTNNKILAKKIRLLRDHGRETKNKLVCYGFTSRLDNLQAAVLNVKFKYLPSWIKRRRKLAAIYHQGLSNINKIFLPPPPQSKGRFFDVYQNYVIKARKRDKLALFLKEKSIETIISNPIPIHHQKSLKLSHFNLPNTEQFAKEVISLPLIPELNESQIKYVIKSIHTFYG
ncbi:DegT/DnrJ/EryC1/StrS family aminotransferase [Patescibacteria group bacterium AH-259-L05]|nr:DegT/DnrJ/EryC1/StrS family aminotransferase [Patescibacteria group bacterium AH-259-L05]